MYEPIADLWKQYRSKYACQWAQDDPRHDLTSEVENRLRQLDLVLDLLRASMAVIEGDPEEKRREGQRFLEGARRPGAGEITGEEYEAWLGQFAPSREQGLRYVRAWEEAWLHTETFYSVAWRIREVLNGRGPLEFPNLREVKARGIRDVRNSLIQHPERARSAPNYKQQLVVRSDGPVLKGGMWFKVRGGRVEPLEEELDRGLYVNAEDFRRELETRLIEALA